MNKFPKSEGAVFINQKKTNDKQPDFTGSIEVTRDQINMLMQMNREGQPVKLQLAVWKRVAKESGAVYLYVSAEAYKKDLQFGQQPQQAQQYQKPQAPADPFGDDLIPF